MFVDTISELRMNVRRSCFCGIKKGVLIGVMIICLVCVIDLFPVISSHVNEWISTSECYEGDIDTEEEDDFAGDFNDDSYNTDDAYDESYHSNDQLSTSSENTQDLSGYDSLLLPTLSLMKNISCILFIIMVIIGVARICISIEYEDSEGIFSAITFIITGFLIASIPLILTNLSF